MNMLRTSCMIIRVEGDVLLLEALSARVDFASVRLARGWKRQVFVDLRLCSNPCTVVMYLCRVMGPSRLCVLLRRPLFRVKLLLGLCMSCPVLVTSDESACVAFIGKARIPVGSLPGGLRTWRRGAGTLRRRVST